MFSARLEGDLKVDRVFVAPSGAKVYGKITDARRGGNIAGKKNGAKTGAKVGTGVSVISRGEQISIPAGSVLEFTLAGALVIQ